MSLGANFTTCHQLLPLLVNAAFICWSCGEVEMTPVNVYWLRTMRYKKHVSILALCTLFYGGTFGTLPIIVQIMSAV